MEKNGVGVLEIELRLGLPGAGAGGEGRTEKKRGFTEICLGRGEDKAVAAAGNKSQVVGWPPVAAHRLRNAFNGVKVSMDGVPFLRKIDLGAHKGYSQLVGALEGLFGCFRIGQAMKEESDEDIYDYVAIYEDKEGDWMLLGDVPWEMFTETCKRLRIMKKKDAAEEAVSAKDLLKGLSEKV